MSEDNVSDELPVVKIEPGTVVVYTDEDGKTADTVTETDGEFVRVQSYRTGDGDRWLHIKDIGAVGLYGDESEWVLPDDETGDTDE